MNPAVAALLGALIGASGPVVVALINSRADRKQERLRLAVQLAVAEHEERVKALQAGILPDGQRVLPMALYLDYHARMIDALDDGKLTAEAFDKLHREHRKVKETYDSQPPYPVPPRR